jgi:hypothetical protein
LASGYNDDGDEVVSSPSESGIDDDDLCDIPSTEAATLSHYRSPPQSFKEIFAQEE